MKTIIEPLVKAFTLLEPNQDNKDVRDAMTYIDEALRILESNRSPESPRLFECFWGVNYRADHEKSILEYHTIEFFTEDRGYEYDQLKKINALEIGDQVELGDHFSTHWVRRMK